MHKILAIAILVASGYLVRKLLGMDKVFSWLTKLLFYVAIPITIFVSTLRVPSVPLITLLTALAFMHLLALFTVALYLSSKLGTSSSITVAMLSALPNTVFLAIPLSIALIGDPTSVLPHAIAFNAMLILATLYTNTKLSTLARDRYRYTSALPHVIAFAIAILFKSIGIDIEIPHQITSAISIANYTAFLIIGSELVNIEIVSTTQLLYVAIMRLGLSPALALAILAITITTIDIPPNLTKGFILQSLMPPAITNIILSKIYRLNTRLTISSIAILTPISITITTLAIS